jgi:hypothetical protein
VGVCEQDNTRESKGQLKSTRLFGLRLVTDRLGRRSIEEEEEEDGSMVRMSFVKVSFLNFRCTEIRKKQMLVGFSRHSVARKQGWNAGLMQNFIVQSSTLPGSKQTEVRLWRIDRVLLKLQNRLLMPSCRLSSGTSTSVLAFVAIAYTNGS